MKILKRDYWWVWLLMFIFADAIGIIILAALLDCLDKDEWYANYKYWVIGAICLLFPIFIMLAIFVIQMLCRVAAKLNVPGKNIYLSPYAWIILLAVPIFGWILFAVLQFYLLIRILIALYHGAGEKYL